MDPQPIDRIAKLVLPLLFGLSVFALLRPALRSGRSFAAILNSQRAHAAIEMAAVHSHQLGRARNVAFGLGQLFLNELAMVRVSRFLERGESEGSRGRLFLAMWRQVARAYFHAWMHDHNSLDSVFQLAHVSGPRIVLQFFDHFKGKLFWFSPVRPRKLLVKVFDQQRHILET